MARIRRNHAEYRKKDLADWLTVAVYAAMSLIFAYLIFSGIRIAYEYVCAGGIEP